LFYKICEKCGDEFETKVKQRRFCCKSCANSVTTSLRRVPDESLFKDGINEINAYILGIIYSDGCLTFDKHSHRYKLNITLNDQEIMNKIHGMMTPNKKLYEYKHPRGKQTSYSIISSNEEDIDFIVKLGVTERKSKVITFPKLATKYIRHFVRGYFDGDGSVYINRTKTNYKGVINHYEYINASFTTGSENFAKQLLMVLNNKGINANLVKDSREYNDSWYVKIYDKKSIGKFYNWIYRDAGLYLERKQLIFNDMI